MKKLFKSLLLMVCMLGTVVPAWGQASTEGKEFWVALLMANSPSGFSAGSFQPFIAISAKKKCQVTVSNPAQNWSQATRTVQADSWTVINDIPIDKWYDQTWTANNASEVVSSLGIKVEATEEVSVYAAIRMEYSYDATNVLPTTALGSEYIIQDYPPYNSEGESHAAFMIVATEDNTTVRITPSTTTQKNKPANTFFEVNLSKGQTYQVVGKDKASFSGTTISAYTTGNRNTPKKIAVYSGADFTQVPGGKSARDCLYEQAMPTDYWGTQFVVTRSMEKDANRVRITAQTNGTTISIDGIELANILNAGETYEFEMSDNLGSSEMASAISKAGREVPDILSGEAHYIETSCPVAVFEYDVSSDYRFSSTTKIGDPSMVWISPLQQRISKITFGACGTSGSTGHTNRHFANIVCLTADASTVKLSSEQRSNIPLSFAPIPGNPLYSYARVFLVDTDGNNPDKVFTLTSKSGVVAHVYGSGNNESYAYSVGSAAVKQGINVNGETFVDGYRSNTKFCLEDIIQFDASVGTDQITRVDWNFGDGTTLVMGEPQMEHQYVSPGWYDVTAQLYGHQVCTNESEQYLGSVQFSFRLVQQDTIMGTAQYRCLSVDTLADNPERRAYILEFGENDTVRPDVCYEPVVINYLIYGEEADTAITIEGYDSVKVNGETYYLTQDISYVTPNPEYPKCDMNVNCHIHIIQCMDLQVDNDPTSQHICPGDALNVTYSKTKGDIGGKARFIIAGLVDDSVYIDNNNVGGASLALPTYAVQKPGNYRAQLIVPDMYCDDLTFNLDFTVYYPSDIFKRKFNNVLAVYNAENNGGYHFTHYEWHLVREGQDTIIGGDQSVYHQELPFEQHDVVYVVLTDDKGYTLRSCEQEWTNVPDFHDEPSNAPAAQKVIRNQRMYIRLDGRTYDMYGQRIE